MSLKYHDNARASFVANSAVEAYRHVKLRTDGKVEHGDAFTPSIGVTIAEAAAGEPVAVKLFNAPGTFPVTVSEAVAAGNRLYQGASGKFDDTPVGAAVQGGTANEAATADGAQIEMVPDGRLGQYSAVRHSVTAAEASAGDAVVDTGLGSALIDAIVQVRVAATGAPRVLTDVTISAGVVTVDIASIAENDVVLIIPIVAANAEVPA